MKLIKNVKMLDNRGQEVEVTGVLSNDGMFAAGASVRSYIGEWKESSTGTGNKSRPVGFGDINVFRADNVQESEDGYVTADLTHIQGPLGMRANEIDPKKGDHYTSINTYLDDKATFSKTDPKLFKAITNPQIISCVLDAVNVASQEMLKENSGSKQAKLALAQNAFAQKAQAHDAKAGQTATVTYKPQQAQIQDASTEAVNASDVLPD